MLAASLDTAAPPPSGASATTRVRAVALVSGVSLERDLSVDEITEHLKEPDNLLWVDITEPGPEESSMLLEVFGFHPLAVEDCTRGDQRPKVDEYKGYSFVVTYAALPVPNEVHQVRLVEIDMFIGRNFLVTVHREAAPTLADAMGRWSRGGMMLREGVGFLVYTVMDAIIDTFFPILERIGEEIDDLETGMFTEFNDASVHTLLRAKRTLFRMRRVVLPMRETFNHFLRRDQSLFSANTAVYLQDVYDHVLRIVDAVDIQRDTVAGALDAYMTSQSHRLNGVMKTLTVVSVAAAIANCVFGAWGMNVRDIPSTFSAPAFWFAIGLAAALVVGALFIGKKKGWL